MQFMERYLEDTLDLGTDRMILALGWGYVDAPEEEALRVRWKPSGGWQRRRQRWA